MLFAAGLTVTAARAAARVRLLRGEGVSETQGSQKPRGGPHGSDGVSASAAGNSEAAAAAYNVLRENGRLVSNLQRVVGLNKYQSLFHCLF